MRNKPNDPVKKKGQVTEAKDKRQSPKAQGNRKGSIGLLSGSGAHLRPTWQ